MLILLIFFTISSQVFSQESTANLIFKTCDKNPNLINCDKINTNYNEMTNRIDNLKKTFGELVSWAQFRRYVQIHFEISVYFNILV